MSTQQECPGCLGNGKLSWQKPAVIQLCYESGASGDCRFPGSSDTERCVFGYSAPVCDTYGADG